MKQKKTMDFNESNIKIYEDRITKLETQKDHINQKIGKWENKLEKLKL